jgi:hypothetical protein
VIAPGSTALPGIRIRWGRASAAQLRVQPPLRVKLLDLRLLELADGDPNGYQVHDWLQYDPADRYRERVPVDQPTGRDPLSEAENELRVVRHAVTFSKFQAVAAGCR